MLRPISRIQIQLYIYTLVQTIISVQAKLEVVRRKHIVHLTGFGTYSSTYCKGTDNCASTMGVDQLYLHGQAVDTQQCQQRQTPFETYCRPNVFPQQLIEAV